MTCASLSWLEDRAEAGHLVVAVPAYEPSGEPVVSLHDFGPADTPEEQWFLFNDDGYIRAGYALAHALCAHELAAADGLRVAA